MVCHDIIRRVWLLTASLRLIVALVPGSVIPSLPLLIIGLVLGLVISGLPLLVIGGWLVGTVLL